MAFDFVAQPNRAVKLIRISQPVATELEITGFAHRQMKSPGSPEGIGAGGKALLIGKPTVNSQPSPFPVAINTMGLWKCMALILDANSVDEVAAEPGSLMKAKPSTSFREAIKLLGQALDLRHAKPKLVKNDPCKEVIHKFDESRDLTQSARLAQSLNPQPSTLLNLPIRWQACLRQIQRRSGLPTGTGRRAISNHD